MLKDFFGIFSWAVGSNIWRASFSWCLSKGYPRVQQEVWSRSPVSALPRGERAIQSWLLPLFQPNFKSCGNPSLWIHFQANRFRQMCGQSHSGAEPLRDHHHHFPHRRHHYNHHAFKNSYTHPTPHISHISLTPSSNRHHHIMNMHFQTPCISNVVHYYSLTIHVQIPTLPLPLPPQPLPSMTSAATQT